jgi:hypothetical protein
LTGSSSKRATTFRSATNDAIARSRSSGVCARRIDDGCTVATATRA